MRFFVPFTYLCSDPTRSTVFTYMSYLETNQFLHRLIFRQTF